MYHHEEYGEQNIKGIQIIGYERKWGSDEPSKDVIGHWFESTTGNHFEYVWEVGDDTLTIWGGHKGSAAAFKGKWSSDRNTITGRWEWPGGGYETTSTRVK